MNARTRELGIQSARWTLGLLYLLLAGLKIAGMIQGLSNSLLPFWLLAWIGSVELCFGFCFVWLKSPVLFFSSFLFSLFLLLGFLVLLLGGIDLSSCGCFGSLQVQLKNHLLVLAGLIGVSLYAWFLLRVSPSQTFK